MRADAWLLPKRDKYSDPRELLTDDELRRLRAWVDYLDIDIDLAQAVLARPASEWPELPAEPGAPLEERPAPRSPRGAYARRARRG